MKIVDAIRARIDRLSVKSQQRLRLNKMKLHPDVVKAFLAAWAPAERRKTPSAFESTSRGASWWPRRLRFVSEREYFADGSATLHRIRPKRDKSVSARQAKRERMARLRTA